MHPKTDPSVGLLIDMVVIGGDCFGPLQMSRADGAEQRFLDQQPHLSPIFFSKPARQARVTEVCGTGVCA